MILYNFIHFNDNRRNVSLSAEGVWGSWTETSSCTVTCGGGTQTFARVCTHHAGVGCQGDATKTVVCGGRECPG